MKGKSLQEIEDFYKNRGYRGNKLRKILAKDKEWAKYIQRKTTKTNKKLFFNKNRTKEICNVNK